MKPAEKTITISTASQIPPHDVIANMPYGQQIILLFKGDAKNQREQIGHELKTAFPDFQIGIDTTEALITILKLISYEDIEKHQLFFEQCAKDYRNLSRELITQLAAKLEIDLTVNYPWDSFIALPKENNTDKWEHGNISGMDIIVAFYTKKPGRKLRCH